MNKENGHHMCLGVGRIEEVAKLFLLWVFFLEINVPSFNKCIKIEASLDSTHPYNNTLKPTEEVYYDDGASK